MSGTSSSRRSMRSPIREVVLRSLAEEGGTPTVAEMSVRLNVAAPSIRAALLRPLNARWVTRVPDEHGTSFKPNFRYTITESGRAWLASLTEED